MLGVKVEGEAEGEVHSAVSGLVEVGDADGAVTETPELRSGGDVDCVVELEVQDDEDADTK